MWLLTFLDMWKSYYGPNQRERSDAVHERWRRMEKNREHLGTATVNSQVTSAAQTRKAAAKMNLCAVEPRASADTQL